MSGKEEINCYENRELSWLRFNERVLEEARNPAVPLMERLGFLSIFQSNLDEFFMVRVGSLEDQKFLKKEVCDNKTGMTSEEQLRAIAAESARLCRLKDATYQGLMDEVGCQGFFLTNFQELSEQEEDYLHHYFLNEILPLLSVMIVGRKQPFPFLKNKEIYAMAVLETKSDKKKIGIIPCSSQVFPRLIKIPTKKNTYMLSEELILHFLPRVFREYKVVEKTLLRITRNADIDMNQAYDEDLDYRDYMAQIIKQRKKLSPVRLEITRNLAPEMTKRLRHYFELEKERMFISGAPLDLSFVGEIKDIMREKKELFFEPRTPQKTTLLKDNEPIIPQILQNKILEKIDGEIECVKKGEQGYIGVKINSLTDKKIIDRLIEASQAGVKIELLIRGINCLHSGIEGLTDNIEVHSIVGRFLEHSRIYIFGTPDRDEIYIASADFMTRNTLRRVEVAAPIYDEKLKLRIREMFVTMFSDNIKGRIQQPDGSYLIPAEADTRLESQECFYEQAYDAKADKEG